MNKMNELIPKFEEIPRPKRRRKMEQNLRRSCLPTADCEYIIVILFNVSKTKIGEYRLNIMIYTYLALLLTALNRMLLPQQLSKIDCPISHFAIVV